MYAKQITAAEHGFDYDDLLEAAEASASGEWEMNFVADQKERFSKWGEDTLVSDKQLETLAKIARV